MTSRDKLFLGGTDRVMTSAAAKWLKQVQPKSVLIPCAGAFRLVHQAVLVSGAQNVHASDIGLYSCLLGTLAAGRSANSLKLDPTPWTVSEPDVGKIVAQTLNAERPETILWAIRLQQMVGKSIFHQFQRREWLNNREKYFPVLAAQMNAIVEPIRGIRFECGDLRKILPKPEHAGATLLINPPAYAKGYAKMFAAEGLLSWRVADEYDLAQEWPHLVKHVEGRATASLMLLSVPLRAEMEAAKYPWEEKSVFVQEKKKKGAAVLHWLEFVPKNGKKVTPRPTRVLGLALPKFKRAPRYPMWRESDGLRSTDKFTLHPASQYVADYYRDLWTHKLKGSDAGMNYIFAVNGKVWGVAGFILENKLGARQPFLYEVYAVSAQCRQIARPIRALMLCICSGEMVRLVLGTQSQNRTFDIEGIKTTCLSKYRKVKHHRPPWQLVETQKKDHMLYDLTYACPVQKSWTFQDAIRFWEKENAELARNGSSGDRASE